MVPLLDLKIAIVGKELGDYRKSIEYHEKHLKIAIEIGDRSGQRAYGSLGNSYDALGDYNSPSTENPFSTKTFKNCNRNR